MIRVPEGWFAEKAMSIDAATGVELPRGPNAEDAFIREAGFQIAERPTKGPPIWTRLGKSYSQGEAFDRSRREQPRRKELAEAAEAEAIKKAKRGV
jgi:hypothetical protein